MVHLDLDRGPKNGLKIADRARQPHLSLPLIVDLFWIRSIVRDFEMRVIVGGVIRRFKRYLTADTSLAKNHQCAIRRYPRKP
jgi:hypothetical protein